MKNNIVIIGSGISGLMGALLLGRKHPESNIYVVEKNKELGGLLRRFDYGEKYGSFDYGMHNILETGEKELDDIVFSLLPENEWQLLEGRNRDLAGVYVNNTLQYHTPFIDVRNLPADDASKCIAEFFMHLNEEAKGTHSDESKKNAKDFSSDRFGKFVASKTTIPAVEKIHQKPAEELDYMATLFTPMSRIAMFDEPLIKEITQSTLLRDRIAFSDQRNLPLEKSAGRKAFYPVKYGMYRVVEALENELKKIGVHLLTEAELIKVQCSENKITELHIKTTDGEINLKEIEKLLWTGAMPLLARFLDIPLSDLGFDRPLKTIVVSILLDKPLNMPDLYYFFCYEPGFNTYRLNNFTAYCNGAPRNGLYPISIELLMNDEQIKNSEKSLEEIAKDELKRFNVMSDGTQIVFAKAELLESGFPMPSVKNIHALNTIRSRIKERQLSNLEMVGILAEENLFFQTDVLRDTYLKINKT